MCHQAEDQAVEAYLELIPKSDWSIILPLLDSESASYWAQQLRRHLF